MNYIGQRIKIINMDGLEHVNESISYINKMGFIIEEYDDRFVINYDLDYMNAIDTYNGHILLRKGNIEIIEKPKYIYGGTGDCIGFVPSNIYKDWTEKQWSDYDQYLKYMGLPSRVDMGNALKVISKRLSEIQE